MLNLKLFSSCLRQALIVGDFPDKPANVLAEVVAELVGCDTRVFNRVVEDGCNKDSAILDFADFSQNIRDGDWMIDVW